MHFMNRFPAITGLPFIDEILTTGAGATFRPAPKEETKMDEKKIDQGIMQYFQYEHLKEPLRPVSAEFCELAKKMDALLPQGAEKAVCLRKLLEAKDAGVRSFLSK